MDVDGYFKSLSAEVDALKNRIRYLIGNAHWLTDGEWKEAVVRSVLRRHLPITVCVGSGFIVGSEKTSAKVDILLYDGRKPVLFKDGDLVFVTPDAVLGIIEIKSKIHSVNNLREFLSKLSDKSDIVYSESKGDCRSILNPFVGLFSYDTVNISSEDIGSAIKSAASISDRVHQGSRIVNHISLGTCRFVKYWDFDDQGRYFNKWRIYDLKHNSFGYFIHNAIDVACGGMVSENSSLWFPSSGKSSRVISEVSLDD